MNAVTQSPPPMPSLEDIQALRAYCRRERNAGYFCCLAGVLAMIAGRYMTGAPGWLMSAGLGVVVFGWGLLAYAVVKRVSRARQILARTGHQ
ncbi:MAG: hypothetical protein ACREEB_02310 [Caulobacteraceae bacterium]